MHEPKVWSDVEVLSLSVKELPTISYLMRIWGNYCCLLLKF